MSNNRKKIIIIGATSKIAEHTARLWVQQYQEGVDLYLVARDSIKLDKIKQDLLLRGSNININTHSVDFCDAQQINNIVEKICGQAKLDIVLIAHGALPEQTDCQQDVELLNKTLMINSSSPIIFAEKFIQKMIINNHGTLAIIGSVASDRGKKSNYIYGAAKAMVDKYIEGLQHYLAVSKIHNVKAIVVKPGPTQTPMTEHMLAKSNNKKLNFAKVENVAKDIVAGINKGKPVIYTPIKWWLIMKIIKFIPRSVFNKIDI